jgi:ClpP class serine protease
MAMDATRKIFEHLQAMNGEKIDLFLMSNGGDGTVPWRLVTLIREFTKDFSVLIPWRAFSAATLTSLGANHIVMHPMGMLGPTDPTVNTPFNPRDAVNGQFIGISVEAVSAYIDLVKQDVGIQHEDELI